MGGMTILDERTTEVLAGVRHDDVTALRMAETLSMGDGGGSELHVRDMPVLKAGTFNGTFTVTPEDLDAMVAAFNELVETETFRPVFRVDHSMSVTERIGYFTGLRTEVRPDPSAGGTPTAYLLGDVTFYSTDAEDVRAGIRAGKLNERSSEIFPYTTNDGREYPMVFGGCAFVDIPAVEGLGAIKLRRASSSEMESEMPDEADETTAGVTETPPVEDETVTEDEAVVTVAEDEPVALSLDGVKFAAKLTHTERAELLAAARAEVQAGIEAGARFEKHVSRGVVKLSVRDQVKALLSHRDAAVRDGVNALLETLTPPVALGAKLGKAQVAPRPEVALSATVHTPETLLAAKGTPRAAEIWAELSSEQRANPEFVAAAREAIS